MSEKDEDSNSTHKSRTIIWVILGITIAILIVFVVLVVLFFAYFKPIQYHQIQVTNKSNKNFMVLVGATDNKGAERLLPVHELIPDASYRYYCTPGTSVFVEGYVNGDQVGSNNAFTRAVLSFAGENYRFVPNISDGHTILGNLLNNEASNDSYNISFVKGFNYPLDIGPLDHTAPTNGNTGVCFTISTKNIDYTQCPDDLKGPGPFTGGTGTYQYCESGCFANPQNAVICCTQSGICSTAGGCWQDWPNHSYYNVFSNACPSCIIMTTCDHTYYQCQSSGGLSNYQINFYAP